MGRFAALLAWASLSLLIAAWATGRVERAYEVFEVEEAALRIGPIGPALGAEPPFSESDVDRVRIADLAELHRPRLFLPPGRISPPLLEVRWEAVPTVPRSENEAGPVYLIYWHVFEDEIHPQGPTHLLYSLWRSAYFGHPPRDIEYFQLKIEPRTGEVIEILHETDPEAAWDEPLPEHWRSRVRRVVDGSWVASLSGPGDPGASRDGRRIEEPAPDPQFGWASAEERSASSAAEQPFRRRGGVLVGVRTWNHLTRLLVRSVEELEAEGWQYLEAPLEPLDDATYRMGKYARKSQGDHRSREPKWQLPALAASLFFGPLLGWKAWRRYRSRIRRLESPRSRNL